MKHLVYEKPFLTIESIFEIANAADKEEKAWLSAGCCDPTTVLPN